MRFYFLIIIAILVFSTISYSQPQNMGNGLYKYLMPTPPVPSFYKFNIGITKDIRGNIWVARKSIGVLKFNGQMWSGYYNVANGNLPSDSVNCIESEVNSVYVGTAHGLAKYDGMNWSQYTVSNTNLPHSSILCISVLNNNLWVGTRDGLCHWTGSNWNIYDSTNSPLVNDSVYKISQSLDGTIWVASSIGLYKLKGSNWTYYNSQNSNLGNDNILDVCVDNSDELWLNVDSNGLYKFDLSVFKTADELYPPYNIGISSVDIQKNIDGGGVSYNVHYYKNAIFSLNKELIAYDNYMAVMDFFVEDNGAYWFLSQYGNYLYCLKKNEVKTYATQKLFDANNIQTGISNRGFLFYDKTNYGSVFEVPAGSGKSTVNLANFWAAAKDQNGELYVSAETYGFNSPPSLIWSPGPVMHTSLYKTENPNWDKLWKVYRTEVDYHKLHWQDPGYQIANSINEWPGNGDTTKGQALQLAPFIDLNSNNIYEPQNGDYPQFCGDQAIFFVFNDDYIGNNSFGNPLKIQVQGLAYGFDAVFDSAIYNTLFFNYKIVNRSNNNYDSLYLGIFADFDIWYKFDDYIGTDSGLSLIYGYNGENKDFSGYAYPPASGVAFLDKQLTNSMPVSSPYLPYFPETDTGYYNFMQSRFPYGKHLYYGGYGLDSNRLSNYIYSGIPSDTSQWSEGSVKYNNPYDRAILGTTGPYKLLKDSSINLDWAVIYARNFTDTNAYSSVDILRQRTAAIHDFYQNHLSNHCISGYTNIDEIEKENNILVYPNPANSKLFISSQTQIVQSVEIYDITAKRLLQRKVNSQTFYLDINHLRAGMYFIRIELSNSFEVQKFIKE